jgi:hypothetical protein
LTEIDPKDSLNSLLGKKPWGIALGLGSMLTMEFGSQDPRQSAVNVHGEWHLWLYMCSWRLESDKEIIIACEDEPEKIKKLLTEISWTEVSSVSLSQPSLDLEITFHNQCKIRTFSVNASDDHETQQWIFFTPQLVSISAKGNSLVITPNMEAPPASTR